MSAQDIITNVISIGTADNPVNKIYANYIIGCKNITYDSPVYSEGPEAETLTGIEVDTVTNAVTSKSNHTCSGSLTVTGAAQVNNTLGVTGTATMAAITASGIITANGGLTLGANMTTGAYWIRGSGANVGMKFTGENVEFSGTLSTGGLITCGGNIKLNGKYISNDGNNEGISINDSGQVTTSTIFTANGQINANGGISGTSISMTERINTDEYYQLKDGISAPATTAGVCKIYVDSSDGFLYAKDGAGNIGLLTNFT